MNIKKMNNEIKYKVIEMEDISQSAKRLSVKILVDSTKKDELKNLIETLTEELKYIDYAKEKTIIKFGNKPYEVIYLLLYSNIRQVNFGFPLCRVQWIDDNCKYKPMKIQYDEIVGDSILIEWQDEFKFFDQIIKENEIGKEEFLKYSDEKFDFIKDTYENFAKLFTELISNKIEFNIYVSEILRLEDALNGSFFDFYGFPDSSVEGLAELHNHLQSAITDVHNVLVVAKNKDYSFKNVVILTKIYLQDAKKNIEQYFELRKSLQ
ncbi:MAG: hypothetical protein C6W54_11055 [Bacillaceae bacterium]|uniref:hypothetical protein n=1 Tax=Aeribacillus sp. FSL K6-8210 TaxID=2954683 RepID=UPI000E3914F1|nr:MAG: hypothetical protein C6W54_11055 [Bacillaceae bacterium]